MIDEHKRRVVAYMEREAGMTPERVRLIRTEAGSDPIKRLRLIWSVMREIAATPPSMMDTVKVQECASICLENLEDKP